MKRDPEREARLDLIFKALSDQTRREILRLVGNKTCRITELARPFEISLAAISKHIKLLERAGFITREIDGRIHRCSLNVQPLNEVEGVVAFYRRFWTAHLDELADAIDELSTATTENRE